MAKIVGLGDAACAGGWDRSRNLIAPMRKLLGWGLAATILVALAGSADAAARKHETKREAAATRSAAAVTRTAKNRRAVSVRRKSREPAPMKNPFGDMPKGPLQIVVSIADQRVTLFSNGVRVADGPVSTGTPSHPTPTGVFSIIGKSRHHRSNLYSNAPMPYMQRLTWSGVAMHEGPLPGYPASHGCIRLTQDFASRLWLVTKPGVRVVVARHAVAPVDFAHPNLFVPKPKSAEPVVAAIAAADAPKQDLIQLADAGTTTGQSDQAVQMSDATVADPAQPVAAAEPMTAAVAAGGAVAAKTTPKTEPADTLTLADAVKPAELVQPAATVQSAKPAEPVQPAAQVQFAKTPEVSPASADIAAAGTAEAKASEPFGPATPARDAADPPKPTLMAADPVKPEPPVQTAEKPAPAPKGKIAVFISRKEMKLYVRQGFTPLFELPITVENPDQPWGTHVFTAMEFTDDGTGMRWNVITMPSELPRPAVSKNSRKKSAKAAPRQPVAQPAPPLPPAQALDRIKIPQEAIDRIGERLIPGSSLVISDQGLGWETGKGTDFIVVTRK